MERIDEIVNLYLKMDTNYALLITGEWGVGKTFYFKNNLKILIEQTPVFNNNQKRYKPIYVSLFGLKSIDEIQLEIFLCLHPFLKNPKVKLGASIIKLIANGIIKANGGTGLDDILNNLEDGAETLINFDELVICFDDLERISPQLKLKELIGYVNKLVENENIKILVIANEKQIERKEYLALKEKIIGNSIDYVPNFIETYDSIISKRYNGYKTYRNFLNDNKAYIIEAFEKNSSNFRILIFALNYFHTIYSEIEINIKKEEGLNERKDEILLTLLRFTLAISIQYKEGSISFKNKNGLDAPLGRDMRAFLARQRDFSRSSSDDNISIKTYQDEFLDKFYKDITFNFFDSIYNYLTGGASFKYNELILELKDLYHIKDDQIPIQYLIFNSLNYPSCFYLTNRKYLRLTREMLNHAKKGLYDLSYYLLIFQYITRFENPLKQDPDQLEQDIISGMKKGVYDKYNNNLEMVLTIPSDYEFKSNLVKIRNEAIAINSKVLVRTEHKEAKELEKLCYRDFSDFVQKVYDPPNSQFNDSLFSHFNINEFYSFFHKSRPEQKWEIARFFAGRYNDFPTRRMKSEILFLQMLHKRISTKNKNLRGKNVLGFIYATFEKTLQKAIESLNGVLD